jgi:hypothetical protein
MEQTVKDMGDLVDKGDFQQVSQALLCSWVGMPTHRLCILLLRRTGCWTGQQGGSTSWVEHWRSGQALRNITRHPKRGV